jgi:hypothetical protein
MARKAYEGSPADVASDKREAKKRGMSMADWEASPEDRAMDAAHEPKVAGTNIPEHHFAHGRPRTV